MEVLERNRLQTAFDWILLTLCVLLGEAVVLIKAFGQQVSDSDIHERSWISLSFWLWAVIAFLRWAGSSGKPWGTVPLQDCALQALVVVVAFAVFSLLLVGLIKVLGYCNDLLFIRWYGVGVEQRA